MAHEIAEINGRPAAAFFRDPAWHGLGTVTDEVMTAANILALAGLDWNVDARPIYTMVGKGTAAQALRPVPGKVALVRDCDEYTLGIASARYKPHQNADALSFMDDVVGESLSYEAAGALRDGSRIWILARLDNSTIRPVKGDDIVPYLLLTTTHDGSGTTTCRLTTVRVVCNNTLRASLGESGVAEVRVRHTTHLHTKIDQAQEILGFAQAGVAAFAAQMDAMVNSQMNTEAWDAFMEKMLPGESTRTGNLREQLTGLFEDSPVSEGLAAIAGTRYAALQAVTNYTTHGRATRIVDGRDPGDARLDSLWFGDSAKMQDRAMALLLADA